MNPTVPSPRPQPAEYRTMSRIELLGIAFGELPPTGVLDQAGAAAVFAPVRVWGKR